MDNHFFPWLMMASRHIQIHILICDVSGVVLSVHFDLIVVQFVNSGVLAGIR